jgi:hypothetical protein
MRATVVSLAWCAVLIAAIVLAMGTARQIADAGLTGVRPPLPAAQIALRIAIVVGAIGLWRLFRHPLERATLVVGAAAAGSSALFGFGLRSAFLSAFRLLSHLAAYMLAAACAGSIVRGTRSRGGIDDRRS